MEAGSELGAEAAADWIHVFSEEEARDALAEIPEDSSAALILLGHCWAIPLRAAVARAGGCRVAAEFISPLDPVEMVWLPQRRPTPWRLRSPDPPESMAGAGA